MGTGADFYLGTGTKAKYLGSIFYDGHFGGSMTRNVSNAKTQLGFRAAVEALAFNSDASWSAKWRWKWPTSATTDYAYHFLRGTVYVSCMGRGYRTPAYYKWWEAAMRAAELAEAAGVEPVWPPELFDDLPEVKFPLMRADT
jgi:hypothetical protein